MTTSRVAWREQHGIWTADLANGAIHLVVAYNSSEPKDSPRGYRVSVGNVRLKMLSATLKDGQRRAINMAKKVIASLLADLEVLETLTAPKPENV